MYKLANNTIKLNVHTSKFKEEQSEYCYSCLETGTNVREDFNHLYFACPTILSHLNRAKRIFRENLRHEPKSILINNKDNDCTNFERLISGIMIYVLFSHRTREANKVEMMNISFSKIKTTSCKVSNYFLSNTIRFIKKDLDPF